MLRAVRPKVTLLASLRAARSGVGSSCTLENKIPTNHQAYKVSPNLYSLVSIAFVVGLCGGVVWGVFAAAGVFLDGGYESPWLWSLVALFVTPIIQAFSFAFTAAVGYPIFKWWRSKSNGIYIEGTFSETNEGDR